MAAETQRAPSPVRRATGPRTLVQAPRSRSAEAVSSQFLGESAGPDAFGYVTISSVNAKEEDKTTSKRHLHNRDAVEQEAR